MRYVITGAGQIGTQLAIDLIGAGHEVTVIRRGEGVVEGAALVRGDAGDRDLLRSVVLGKGVAAIFHCIHTSYDSRAWTTDLPPREQAVLDVAAEAGIPVVFPESVYAFGTGAQELTEEVLAQTPVPASPLGEVRAQLLASRAAHPATTLSIVAADLIGPTADPATSVFEMLVLGPASSGKTAWVLGDPDARRSVTWIPDLTAAMVAAAEHADTLVSDGDAVLLAPASVTMAQRQMADAASPDRKATVRHIPWPVLRVAGWFSPMMRELHHQRYLWDSPAVLGRGILETDFGVGTPLPADHPLAA